MDGTAMTRMDTNQMAHQQTTLECQVIKQEDSTCVTAVVESLDWKTAGIFAEVKN